jgi:hypothetical protein
VQSAQDRQPLGIVDGRFQRYVNARQEHVTSL